MKNKKIVTAKNPTEIAKALGITSPTDIALMTYKAELSVLASKSIKKSNLTVNQIVENSGVARSKVSAIKNGSLAGISCDLFLKVIAATGVNIEFKIAS